MDYVLIRLTYPNNSCSVIDISNDGDKIERKLKSEQKRLLEDGYTLHKETEEEYSWINQYEYWLVYKNPTYPIEETVVLKIVGIKR